MNIGQRKRQGGQTAIEYLYVIPILLLLLLASLQFVFIYEAKQTLNYATFAATRAGALNNGNMAAIQEGLASGLAPLFSHGLDLPALKAARNLARDELGNSKLTLIEILNPNAAALTNFGQGGAIPNDNLMYRPTDAKGGMNVQDANLLKVRVTYCVRLVVPLVNRMIFGFTRPAPTQAKIDTYRGGAITASDMLMVAEPTASSGLCVDPDPTSNAYPYRIAVSSEAVVRMQSPFKNPNGTGSNKWQAP